MRVVSLVPSVSETLVAWGVTPVGITRFCEQAGIATVGGTKDPNLERVVDLGPDLVVMDEEENRREDYEALRARGINVLALAVRDVADVEPEMGRLADALGIARPRLDPGPARPTTTRAVVAIWRRPWRFLGPRTYGASLLERAGVVVVPDDRGPYPGLSLDEARDAAPAVVIAPSEPYPFSERHRGELETVAPVVFVDGRDLFWWGARTPSALARVAAALAP
ncbi:MAG TPA: helical backbone metal receptor [Acidimicrobiales bacterium]|nr:helical backbone metal receptor [Acidimicrobiales bacterium]